ncbi:MAG: FoF1 ATP synthase subunit gamma [Chloroflexota bacterium]|nr:FoF1 ATP synthase subunit gamma [Chloroflexota bacterium]
MTQAAGEVQHRLQSLEDIRHLLRSIRAMSAIRWRRARLRLRSAQQYASTVDRQLALATTFPTALTRGAHHPHEEGPSGAKRPALSTTEGSLGLIALTSDQGLCGTFNIGLAAHALDFIERERERGKKIRVIALGEYGERFFRRAGCELLYTQRFPLTHAISFVEARDIVDKVKHFYEAKAFNTLYLIYNQFVSFGRYQRGEVRLLPPDLAAVWHTQKSGFSEKTRFRGTLVPEDLILGTPPQDLQEFLLWEHLAVQVYLALIESLVSEQGARLQTMDAAIANLDERVEELQLQYHAIRQESITREVLEVQSNTRSRRPFPNPPVGGL